MQRARHFLSLRWRERTQTPDKVKAIICPSAKTNKGGKFQLVPAATGALGS